MSAETIAIIAIIVAAGSEIIGMSSLKSNSWVQLLLQALKIMFPKRR
jgi:type IV secretory pathway VirB2 component (pilin)